MMTPDNAFAATDLRGDHFSLFGLQRRQALDVGELEQRYLEVQARVHPDKHAHLSAADQRLAMQWATRVNEAYETLKKPLARARYLLQLGGVDAGLENNTAMEPAFLMQQMELREALAEARGEADMAALEALHRRLRQQLRNEQERLQQLLDGGDLVAAAALVRQLMFVDKLLQETDIALADIED